MRFLSFFFVVVVVVVVVIDRPFPQNEMALDY